MLTLKIPAATLHMMLKMTNDRNDKLIATQGTML